MTPNDLTITMDLDPKVIETLSGVTTATPTTVLLKKGLRNLWLRGPRPIRPGQPRLVGRAFTLRFVPAREDLATPESWGAPISTRAAIEEQPEGWIMQEVMDQGAALPGLYPPNEENRKRYEAFKAARRKA